MKKLFFVGNTKTTNSLYMKWRQWRKMFIDVQLKNEVFKINNKTK